MWKSDEDPPNSKKSTLPPSVRQFSWAKEDREVTRTRFHLRESHWASKTRRAAVEAEAPVKKVDTSMPAWMNYRSKATKAAPLYFRTKAIEQKKKPK
jgi:hypothetical protein